MKRISKELRGPVRTEVDGKVEATAYEWFAPQRFSTFNAVLQRFSTLYVLAHKHSSAVFVIRIEDRLAQRADLKLEATLGDAGYERWRREMVVRKGREAIMIIAQAFADDLA
jgi:hypothetical protein